MNQSQFLAIICNSLEVRERSRVEGAIGFGCASHWLKNLRDSFKPIIKRSNRNHVITFDSHLKTALLHISVITAKFSFPTAEINVLPRIECTKSVFVNFGSIIFGIYCHLFLVTYFKFSFS